MSTNPEQGRLAQTDYEVLEQFTDAAVPRKDLEKIVQAGVQAIGLDRFG